MILSEYEIQQIHEAADILNNNLRVRITIPQLIRKVRLSEKKLIAGFHQEFGTTVYSYYLEARMNRARELLLENTTIRRVAREIGYRGKNAETNFIKAFRKKYDESPASWGKKQLQV